MQKLKITSNPCKLDKIDESVAEDDFNIANPNVNN